ncbi:cyanophycin synthetase [Oscillospiraceae bacterium WX1]
MKANPITIDELFSYGGKNIYSHKPVIKMVVDIGRYGDIPTKDIPHFNEKLLALFPGLRTNCCALGYPGGFLERLREGTYLGHVLEHVILEMQVVLGYDVSFGKTRAVQEPDKYYLVCEYLNEVCALECAKAAVMIFNSLIDGRDVAFDDLMAYLKKISVEAELGPSTQAIADEAKKRGIPVTRIANESLIRLGYGKNSRLVESTLTDATACICADISCNKQLSKHLLSEQKIPVPYGKVVYSEMSALMAAGQIGIPVVIKPLDSNQGKGVHLNLCEPSEIREAFADASKYSSGVIVEQYVTGSDYRVLVVGSAVKAVAKRVPACVQGDGVLTVRALVKRVNSDPNRGDKHERPLTKIRLDDIAVKLLEKVGMTPDTVLQEDEIVYLRENGNISTGGTAVDCTDIIHPDNAELAVRAAAAIGIDIAGIDIVTADISKSILETGGVIVEVNTAPGIRMHLYPSSGKVRNVAADIVSLLFPDVSSTQFPIVSVTGTNGKTTTARLIQHVLMTTGKTVGLTSTSGTFINKKCICRGDNSGPTSARSLLANKAVDAAVLETARGGIIREGLGYDSADVGVITNITEDHLGLDGVETLEDLVFVKSLVAEAIKDGGYAVVNALDAATPGILKRLMQKRINAEPVLFYNAPEADKQFDGLNSIRVFNEGGWIRVIDGDKRLGIVRVTEIPVTLGGRITCNVDNALAAVAALYALKIPAEQIRAGLLSFTDNIGRFELYDYSGVAVMLDYGHNPAGYENAVAVCQNLAPRRLIGVVGMPGDRTDASIAAVGRLCGASFDKLYVKEDTDRRGRASGEVANRIAASAFETGFPRDGLEIILDETAAAMRALTAARRGDLVVIFYEKLAPLQRLLDDLGAIKQYPGINSKILACV